MIIFYGIRLYGTLDKCGTTRIATRFFHIYYLPIIPLGSILVTEDDPDGKSWRGLGLGLNLRSTLAAYARVWLPVAAIASAIPAVDALERSSRVGLGPFLVDAAFTIALAAMAVAVWWKVGRLRVDERGQRLVYSELTGLFADVALLGKEREPMRERLVAAVRERAHRVAATGYRMGPDPASDWDKIALDPTVRDRDFLGAALTLARLEWSLARGAQKSSLASRHDQIWKKLVGIEPALLERAALL